MYRDEILAIGEAVREARKEGAREAADFYRGKLGATCDAARRLLRFAEDMALLMQAAIALTLACLIMLFCARGFVNRRKTWRFGI